MNEKLIALFIIGMGAIRVYEDLDDGDDYYDTDPSQTGKKHSLGRRSIDKEEKNGQYNPIIEREEFMEAIHHGLNPKLLMKCNDLKDSACTCMRILCFNEDDCHSSMPYIPPIQLTNSTVDSNKRWLKKCRQGEVWGQQLCECKRYLTTASEIEKMEAALNASTHKTPKNNEAFQQFNKFGPIFEY